MNVASEHLPRVAADHVREALLDTRIVVINGARQVGKSTLAKVIAREHPGSRLAILDLPQNRVAATADPVGFLRHDGLLVIDEVQRVPELWLALKAAVDLDPRPGRFLLTGSARLLGLHALPDQLPGRSETIELWPLSQGEIARKSDGFIDAAFTHGPELLHQWKPTEGTPRPDYLARVERGGYPEAVARESPRRRRQFYVNYIADLMSRDVHQVADIQRSRELQRMLSLIAAQVGGLLNANRLANQLEISANTVRSYLAILEMIFILRLIPAYSASGTIRTVGAPKVTFVDSGLAAHLTSGMTHDARTGGLLENFVLSELGRQLAWSDTLAQLFHYRDREGYEVDAVLEDTAGNVIGIEVKSGETVRAEDFRGLTLLRKRLGPHFRAGFVLYTGSTANSFGDRLACLPIAALWADQPSSKTQVGDPQ